MKLKGGHWGDLSLESDTEERLSFLLDSRHVPC